MEKTKRWIKHNLLFFISLIVLFLAVVFSVVIFQLFRLQSETESTHVGHIYLGANQSSYERVLNEEINRFLDQVEYEMVYQEHVIPVDVTWFSFDVEETIRRLNANQNNDAIFDVSSASMTSLNDFLSDALGEDMLHHIDVTMLVEGLLDSLGELDYFHTIDIFDYLLETSVQSVIVTKSFTINQSDLMDELALIEDVVIDGQTSFSILTYFEDESISNEAMSFIASAMYNLSLESHFTNMTSHHYQTLPSWADDYTNVRVLKQNAYDYTFYNPFHMAYTFEFEIEDANTVNVSLVGAPYASTYAFVEDVQSVAYPSFIVEDPTIVDPVYIIEDNDDQTVYERLLQNGENGSLTSFIILITHPDGSTEEIVVDRFREDATPEIIGQNIVIKDGE